MQINILNFINKSKFSKRPRVIGIDYKNVSIKLLNPLLSVNVLKNTQPNSVNYYSFYK